jgi:peptidoglycan/LPS O-acetylase OafA/YrhL
MNPIFISHLDRANLLDPGYVTASMIGIISLAFFIVMIFLGRRTPVGGTHYAIYGHDILTLEDTITLQGMAILLLIFGHLSQQLTNEVVSFRITGNAAVCIFLLLSGVAQVKSHGMTSLGIRYMLKWIRRICVPLWVTLILFYTLNYLLLGIEPDRATLVLNVFGILWPGLPNSPAWFITYILFLYAIYIFVTRLPVKNGMKIILLLMLSYSPILWIQALHKDKDRIEI